ncbi:hypothetical protein [Tychonema sp. BBK16]|uniref:hypothetical protein n=1 Tax=Tychonema sp. BBK16 TaxID=2699888 RepID=UPI001F44466B|nr:hypothetical protein [Tychonema sp. BBK16]MCF6372755.1 hypothetical protein [Tychonema sp. BBK16]
MDSEVAIANHKQPAVDFDIPRQYVLCCFGNWWIQPHKVFSDQKVEPNKDLEYCSVKMFVVVSGCACTIKSVKT